MRSGLLVGSKEANQTFLALANRCGFAHPNNDRHSNNRRHGRQTSSVYAKCPRRTAAELATSLQLQQDLPNKVFKGCRYRWVRPEPGARRVRSACGDFMSDVMAHPMTRATTAAQCVASTCVQVREATSSKCASLCEADLRCIAWTHTGRSAKQLSKYGTLRGCELKGGIGELVPAPEGYASGTTVAIWGRGGLVWAGETMKYYD